MELTFKTNHNKKASIFDDKLSECTGKPKKNMRNRKISLCAKKNTNLKFQCKFQVSMETNNALTFDKKSIATIFKDLFSNLTESFIIKLPNAPNMYNLESVFQYYSKFIIEKPFHLSDASEEEVFKIMQNIDNSKAAGIDNLSGQFLKDGAEILTKPITEIAI